MAENLIGNPIPMGQLDTGTLQKVEPGIRWVVKDIYDWVYATTPPRDLASVWSCEGHHKHQNDMVSNKPFVVVVAGDLKVLHELVGHLACSLRGPLHCAEADLGQARDLFRGYVWFPIKAAAAIIIDGLVIKGPRQFLWNKRVVVAGNFVNVVHITAQEE